MPILRRKTFAYLRHLPLLTLYVLFFMVQLFYNLDTPPSLNSKGRAVVKTACAKHETLRADNDANQPAGKKTRLNKRYHPSVAPALIHSYTILACRYLEQVNSDPYQDPFYASSSRVVHSLRGPPACA